MTSIIKEKMCIRDRYKITDKIKVGFQFNGARMLPADSKSVLNAVRTTPIAPVFKMCIRDSLKRIK